jgi:adenylate cyclase
LLSAKHKRTIRQIIPFGIIWFVFGIVYSLVVKGILGNITYYPSTGNPYDFISSATVTGVFALIMGLMMGAIEVYFLHKLFIKKLFWKKMVIKTIIYIVAIVLFLLFLADISNSIILKLSVIDPAVIHTVLLFVKNFSFWSLDIFIGTLICMSLLFAEMSDYIGQGVLRNFFTGMYHTPIEEKRIFMFLDMKSSTTIAEKLGHVNYFKLLNLYYEDMTEAILQSAGEIYQYVGDEIIVSWGLKQGLRDRNCLRLFFSIKEKLEKQSVKYIKAFGLVPSFKAGLHCGNVATGQIGVIKKDIVFTGDVLNTTARIESLCNEYDVDILLSDELFAQLKIKKEYHIKEIGVCTLRGKDEKVKLFTVWK